MNQPLVWDAEQLSPDDASHHLTYQELILTIPLPSCVPAGIGAPEHFSSSAKMKVTVTLFASCEAMKM